MAMALWSLANLPGLPDPAQASRNQLPFLSQPLGHRFGNPRAVLHLMAKHQIHKTQTESARHCKALQSTAKHQVLRNYHDLWSTKTASAWNLVLHMASCCSSHVHPNISQHNGNSGNCHNHSGLDRPPHDSRTAKGVQPHQSHSRRSPWLFGPFPNAARFALEFLKFFGNNVRRVYACLLLRDFTQKDNETVCKTISFWQFEWRCRWHNLSKKFRQIHGIALPSDGVRSGGFWWILMRS